MRPMGFALGMMLVGSAQAASPGPSMPAWMSGHWEAADGGGWIEERWSPPRGGVMLGTNLSGKDSKAQAFEFLRIASEADGTVNYWGSPQGKPAVPFRMVSQSSSEVAFENPKHDFPTRIVYRRSGATMTATVSGPGGKGAQSWTFRLSR